MEKKTRLELFGTDDTNRQQERYYDGLRSVGRKRLPENLLTRYFGSNWVNGFTNLKARAIVMNMKENGYTMTPAQFHRWTDIINE